MLAGSRLFYSTSTPKSDNDPFSSQHIVQIGVVQRNDKLGSVVLYTMEQLHPDNVINDTPNRETMFFRVRYSGVLPRGGTVGDKTIEIVELLEEYSPRAYDPFRGVRISESDNPEYMSKIVVDLITGSIPEVCEGIAKVLHDGPAKAFVVETYEAEKSATEQKDRRDFELVGSYADFDDYGDCCN